MRKKVGSISEWKRILWQGAAGLNWRDIHRLVAVTVVVAVGLLALEGTVSSPRQGGWAGIDAGGWEVGLKALYVLLWPIVGALIVMEAYDQASSAGVTRPGWSRRLVIMAGAAASLALGLMSVPVVDIAGRALARRMGIEVSVAEAQAGTLAALSSVAVVIAYASMGVRRIERWLWNVGLPTQLTHMVHASAVVAAVVVFLAVNKVMTGVLAPGGG